MEYFCGSRTITLDEATDLRFSRILMIASICDASTYETCLPGYEASYGRRQQSLLTEVDGLTTEIQEHV